MRPAHPSLDQFLTYKMHRLMKQHDKRIAQSYADAAQLSLAESRVLAAVGTAGALSNSELARRANLDKSQASRGQTGWYRADWCVVRRTNTTAERSRSRSRRRASAYGAW